MIDWDKVKSGLRRRWPTGPLAPTAAAEVGCSPRTAHEIIAGRYGATGVSALLGILRLAGARVVFDEGQAELQPAIEAPDESGQLVCYRCAGPRPFGDAPVGLAAHRDLLEERQAGDGEREIKCARCGKPLRAREVLP